MPSSDDTQLLHTGDLIESWRGVDAQASGDELVGTTLNASYTVERLLGEGGMGRVYLAQHQRIKQKRVAIKVLHAELARDPQVLARFQREAEAAAAISHPNVVTVLDVDVTPRGMPYMVCEYLEGVDLAEHLKEVKRLDVLDAVSVTRQLCRGLGAAHARGVIHRDLKPANVFLVGDFTRGAPARLFAKILDFGLSRFQSGGGAEQNLTKTGFIMGTPAYMAPEQARGQKVDQRADVYGLGTILYTVLTGRAPFQEETPQATILALLGSEPPRPRSLVPTIPAHLELIIERAMAREPERRYPDMAAFEEALDAVPGLQLSVESSASAAPAVPIAGLNRSAQALENAADIQAAPPRLLLMLTSAVLLLIGAATSAVSGIELASGYAFGMVELRLILLCIVGSSLTPAVLWAVHIRRKVWPSSSRVLALLGQVRAALLAGLISYGLFGLAFHVIDDFGLRFLGSARHDVVGATWRGWNLLLPAASVVTALAVAERRRLLLTIQPGWRRLLAIGLVTTVAGCTVAGLIYLGISWRSGGVR